MYKANKPVSMKQIKANPLQRVLSPAINKAFLLDKAVVRFVANDIARIVWPSAKEVDKERLYDIVFAMLKSVSEESLSALTGLEPRKIEDMAQDKFSRMLNAQKKDFDSPFPAQKMLARSRYYEEIYQQREFIQNWRWEFKDLDEDAGSFIKCREKYKMYARDYALVKGKGKECIICHHCCVVGLGNICTFCAEFDTKLIIFIKLCTSFQTMGSYYIFNWYLSEPTWDYLVENIESIVKALRHPIGYSLIEKYANQCYLIKVTTEEEPEEEPKKELDKLNDMVEMLIAIEKSQEDQKKKEKEDKFKKLFNQYMKEEREKKREKKSQQAYQVQPIAPSSAAKKIEDASNLKSLTSVIGPAKSLDDLGDKTL